MKPLILIAVAMLGATSTWAHTPYLAPSEFAPHAGQTIALDAAFSEIFFVPEAAFDESQFTGTAPDGKVSPIGSQSMKTRTVAEFSLPKDAVGTWRLGTGQRLGARFRTWELNGKRDSSREPDAEVPDGAKVISDFQSRTEAETYVSVGEPSRGALRPRGRGLELVPLTHPSDLYVGETFEFTLQYDGKPLVMQPVEITEAVWNSDRRPQVVMLKTDQDGKARMPLSQAGTWIALTRHRTPAPVNAGPAEYSNSYTLTFRVLNP